MIETESQFQKKILITPILHGEISFVSAKTQTTVGSAGSASALPANPTGYMKLTIEGTDYVIPFYAAT